MLLCSPVSKPWYLIWLIPFLRLFPNRSWIWLTGLVVLSYAYYYNQTFPTSAAWIEYGVFFLVVIWEAFVLKKRWGIIGEWPLEQIPPTTNADAEPPSP